MVGRLLVGGLATLRKVNVLILHSVGLAASGVTVMLLPLCTSIPLLTAFSVLYGLFIGRRPQCAHMHALS